MKLDDKFVLTELESVEGCERHGSIVRFKVAHKRNVDRFSRVDDELYALQRSVKLQDFSQRWFVDELRNGGEKKLVGRGD